MVMIMLAEFWLGGVLGCKLGKKKTGSLMVMFPVRDVNLERLPYYILIASWVDELWRCICLRFIMNAVALISSSFALAQTLAPVK